MTHEALEPCPFCGGSARQSIAAAKNGPHNYAVGCSRCIIQTEWTSTEAEAIAAWNTRPPNPLQAEVEALRTRAAQLEGLLVEGREELLWNAYHTGNCKDGRWTHMFMSDGEWLARECGLDPKLYDYDDAAIRAAVPIAARAALKQEETK